jgi:hypothetical protein
MALLMLPSRCAIGIYLPIDQIMNVGLREESLFSSSPELSPSDKYATGMSLL